MARITQLTTAVLISLLEGSYYSIIAARPDYDVSLWYFLRGADVSADDIWEYNPQIGYDAGQTEPDWL